MRTISFLVLMVLLSIGAVASQKPLADKELMEIVAWLKQADGYTYKVNISNSMKNNGEKKQEQEITIYQSSAESVRYMSSNEDLSFMNKNGFFKVLKNQKEVAYKQFTSDSMWRRAMAAVSVNDAAKLADSILFAKATINSKENKNGLLHYRLSYDPGYMVKEFEITYDTRSKTIISVSYLIERPMDGNHPSETMINQRVRMSGYTHKAPMEVKNIVIGSVDLKKYLNTAFPEYIIHNL